MISLLNIGYCTSANVLTISYLKLFLNIDDMAPSNFVIALAFFSIYALRMASSNYSRALSLFDSLFFLIIYLSMLVLSWSTE